MSKNDRENPTVLHYYNEIIRFWSKLNFIIKKTLRSLNQPEFSDNIEKSFYYYSTYKILWENASIKSIIDTLNLLNNFSNKKFKSSKFYSFLNKLQSFSWDKALFGKPFEEKLSIEEAIPTFFINRLKHVMSLELIKNNIKYMNNLNKKAISTVRVNELSSDLPIKELMYQIKEDFDNKNINLQQDLDFPELFHVPFSKKSLIIKSKWYKSGNLIFQDKSSLAVVHVLAPQATDFICDMCAAPGLKTSLIAQSTNDQAKIIAGEFLTGRINQTKKILNNLKVMNAHLINTDSIIFPVRFKNFFDRILLDAPCTGNGTFLTNPELKWRQNEKFLYQNVILQKKLLERAIELLKPNGILVYSTCSFYPEEGELQILKIINHLDKLEPMDLPEWFSKSYRMNNYQIPGTGRLFPSIHQTQGFFIGKFKKKAL